MRIVHLLICHGQENALTAKQLATFLWEKTTRNVTRAIECERAAGIPICACNNGYYLADTPDELSFYISKFDRRQKSMAITRQGLDDALLEMMGQVKTGGYNG